MMKSFNLRKILFSRRVKRMENYLQLAEYLIDIFLKIGLSFIKIILNQRSSFKKSSSIILKENLLFAKFAF